MGASTYFSPVEAILMRKSMMNQFSTCQFCVNLVFVRSIVSITSINLASDNKFIWSQNLFHQRLFICSDSHFSTNKKEENFTYLLSLIGWSRKVVIKFASWIETSIFIFMIQWYDDRMKVYRVYWSEEESWTYRLFLQFDQREFMGSYLFGGTPSLEGYFLYDFFSYSNPIFSIIWL